MSDYRLRWISSIDGHPVMSATRVASEQDAHEYAKALRLDERPEGYTVLRDFEPHEYEYAVQMKWDECGGTSCGICEERNAGQWMTHNVHEGTERGLRDARQEIREMSYGRDYDGVRKFRVLARIKR